MNAQKPLSEDDRRPREPEPAAHLSWLRIRHGGAFDYIFAPFPPHS